MKSTPQTYVLTLNSPSRKGLRLWTGESIHALRHCSVKQIGLALREMQRNVDSVHAPVSSSGGSYSLNRGR
jgi:hypothetical protein